MRTVKHTIGGMLAMTALAGVLAVRANAALPVPGAAFWIDANNVDGSNNSTLTSGSSVATWKDLSGNGLDLTQADASKQPTFVTNVLLRLPVVRFDGINDDLVNTTAAAFSGQFHTIFVVLKATKPAAEQDIFDQGIGGSPAFQVPYLFSDGLHIFRGGAGATDLGPNGNYTNNQYLIFGSIWQGGVANGSSILINGANQVSGTLPSFGNPASMYLGSNAGLAQFYSGDIAEVVVYNSVLSGGPGGDFSKVESYLIDKWLIPEPSTGLLFGLAGLLVWRWRSHPCVGA